MTAAHQDQRRCLDVRRMPAARMQAHPAPHGMPSALAQLAAHDEDFLAALAHGMPESAGIALGVDRLVMLASGAERIDDVLWVPVG